MSILDNARHEAFANALAKGSSATEAYVKAGYARNDGNAGRLNRNEHILSRVAELKEMAAQGTVVDRQWVIAKLVENVNTCMSMDFVRGPDGVPTLSVTHNPAAANKALELLGKEIGMFVEHSENVNTNYNISDKPLTDDEWAAEHTTH